LLSLHLEGKPKPQDFPKDICIIRKEKAAPPSKMTLAGSLSLSAVGSFRYAIVNSLLESDNSYIKNSTQRGISTTVLYITRRSKNARFTSLQRLTTTSSNSGVVLICQK